MKEAYFIEVIQEISSLCSKVVDEHNSKVKGTDDLEHICEPFESECNLKDYFMSLSDTTLNTVCALMDFGREFHSPVLPINLKEIFNKSHLPYWFDKNKAEKKEWTANYLVDKAPSLSKYLRRAAELLIYIKDKNIALKHKCGGALIEVEGEGYIFDKHSEYDEYDDEDYELKLECIRCKCPVTKRVTRSYFDKQI